jgi:hypothetical protein
VHESESEQSPEQTRLQLIIDALAQQDVKYCASEKKEKQQPERESADERQARLKTIGVLAGKRRLVT